MEKTVGAFEARRAFGKLLQGVTRGDKIVVERHGEPIAAIVPIELYERWKRERQAFFDEMREISEQVSLSEEEAEHLVAEAIAAVRARQPVAT